MQNGNVLRFARVIGCAVLLLALACGDDESAPTNAGGSGGQGGGVPDAGNNPAGLGANVAGKPCSTSAECGGATCATTVLGTELGAQPVAAPGGYCTGTCMTDAECGAGGACIGALPNIAAGSCFATCTAMSDCRDGYLCAPGVAIGGLVIPDTCRPAPETDQLGDDVAGKMCEVASDCAGGECLLSRPSLAGNVTLPGGYCSGACTEDAHCGAGGVCVASLLGGAGSCYEACAMDVDCTRDGYRCRPLLGGARGCNPASDPLPDGTVGQMCSADADCGGAMDTCADALPQAGIAGAIGSTTPAPGGYCSQPCLEDIDCGANGACVGSALGGACFVRCSTGTDCRTGYVCEDRAVMTMFGPDAGTPEPLLVCAPVPDDGEDAGR